MKKLTKRQIADFKAAGRDYVSDAVRTAEDAAGFDGQSEALDMASSDAPHMREAVADWIYEGMREELEKRFPRGGRQNANH